MTATSGQSASARLVGALRRWLFADAPSVHIARQLRIYMPLGLGAGLIFGGGIGGSKFPAPIYSGVVLGVMLGAFWGIVFPSGMIKRHRSAVVRIAKGRDVDIWTLHRERRTDLNLAPGSAFDLCRRAVGRIGGHVLACDPTRLKMDAKAATPSGVALHIAITSRDSGSRVLIVTEPKRRSLALDEGATLRALDLMESVLRNGTHAPLPQL